jgi:hypothetical protein
MMKLKVGLVAAAVGMFGLVGSAAPAQASQCADGFETICAVAATVICKVVAKGQPCLY